MCMEIIDEKSCSDEEDREWRKCNRESIEDECRKDHGGSTKGDEEMSKDKTVNHRMQLPRHESDLFISEKEARR